MKDDIAKNEEIIKTIAKEISQDPMQYDVAIQAMKNVAADNAELKHLVQTLIAELPPPLPPRRPKGSIEKLKNQITEIAKAYDYDDINNNKLEPTVRKMMAISGSNPDLTDHFTTQLVTMVNDTQWQDVKLPELPSGPLTNDLVENWLEKLNAQVNVATTTPEEDAAYLEILKELESASPPEPVAIKIVQKNIATPTTIHCYQVDPDTGLSTFELQQLKNFKGAKVLDWDCTLSQLHMYTTMTQATMFHMYQVIKSPKLKEIFLCKPNQRPASDREPSNMNALYNELKQALILDQSILALKSKHPNYANFTPQNIALTFTENPNFAQEFAQIFYDTNNGFKDEHVLELLFGDEDRQNAIRDLLNSATPENPVAIASHGATPMLMLHLMDKLGVVDVANKVNKGALVCNAKTVSTVNQGDHKEIQLTEVKTALPHVKNFHFADDTESNFNKIPGGCNKEDAQFAIPPPPAFGP